LTTCHSNINQERQSVKTTCSCVAAAMLTLLHVGQPVVTEAANGPSGATTVRLTDNVLVPDVSRLGVHMTGDNYYDSPMRKHRVEENFEGTVVRFVCRINIEDERTVIGHFSVDPLLLAKLPGATYMILSGPDAFRRGRIVAAEEASPGEKRSPIRYVLDRPFRPHEKENGIMVQVDLRGQGFHPGWAKQRKWQDATVPEYFECSPSNVVVKVPAATDSAGRCSMKLAPPASGSSYIAFRMQFASVAPTHGRFHVRLKARQTASENQGTLLLALAGPGAKVLEGYSSETIPTDQWQTIEKTFDVAEQDGPNLLYTVVLAEGGDILIDDVVAWREGDTNPTAYRDEFVELIRGLEPGVLRYLINNSGTLESRLPPPLGQYACGIGYTGSKEDFGMHEFLELCEHLECDPWYTLPGTLTREEMSQLMEYLAAPADTGYGQVRASLGHPQPWTETLKNIYLQFGNEVITFAGRGYPGPDYWQGLIAAAKASPHNRANITFIVDRQTGAGRVLGNAPNADRLCMNSYIMYALRQEFIEGRSRDDVLRYVLSHPYQFWLHEPTWQKDIALANSFGKEISIYEGGNFHTTFGDAPVDLINDIVTSQAGGLAATLDMLVGLKAHGIRTQNSFNLSQFSFAPGGSFGDIQGRVRLWGGVIESEDGRRYRPRMLQLMAANQVIGGDLVETTHSGEEPTFTVHGRFSNYYGGIKNPREATLPSLPVIDSYGFIEGKRRGLILMNLDPCRFHDVNIDFAGEAAERRAQMWMIAPESPWDDNEPEHEQPQVTLEESTLEDLVSGTSLRLAPAAFAAIEWNIK
jgi:hypothetical protein